MVENAAYSLTLLEFRKNVKRIIILTVAALALAVTAAGAPAKKGTRTQTVSLDALFDRADEAMVMYDADLLEETVDEIEARMAKTKNVPDERRTQLRSLQNRLIAIRNMLGRVEQLVIVDSVTVSRDSLLFGYALSADAGTIGVRDGLTSFTPAGAREVFYTQRDSAGQLQIMQAAILDDGTRETPVPLKLFDDASVQTAWPFMMPDGATLYFAADADTDNTMGGWDIFMTRRDDTGAFYEPTNLGMPYNSPGDDYMLVIDENAGIGYWATDRNAPDGEVTVFTFIPSETRINYDAARDDISDLAYITDIGATRPEGFDAQAVLDKAARAREAHAATPVRNESFAFSLGNGMVYTSPSQFRSASARNMLREYLDSRRQLDKALESLDAMRCRYGSGETALGSDIRRAEKQLPMLRARVINLANAIVRAETQH